MNVCINRSSLFIPCIPFAGHIDSPGLSVTFLCCSPETDSIQWLSSTRSPGPINYPWPLFLLCNQLSWILDNRQNILGWNKWKNSISTCMLRRKNHHTEVLMAPGCHGSQVKEQKLSQSAHSLESPRFNKKRSQAFPLPRWLNCSALLPIRPVCQILKSI